MTTEVKKTPRKQLHPIRRKKKVKRRSSSPYHHPARQAAQSQYAVRDCIDAMIKGMGHGGLTWMAIKLGIGVSVLRRRLQKPHGCFDPVTMRAVLLIVQSREDKLNYLDQIKPPTQVGLYNIRVRYSTMYEEHVPTWEVAPAPPEQPADMQAQEPPPPIEADPEPPQESLSPEPTAGALPWSDDVP